MFSLWYVFALRVKCSLYACMSTRKSLTKNAASPLAVG
jgi:hypothetical protein